MYTKKPKEMGSLLMMCGVVYCLKLSHDFHMTLCALICTEFREQSVTAANMYRKTFSKRVKNFFWQEHTSIDASTFHQV